MSTLRCPKCGSDELGLNRLVTECRDIHSGQVLSRVDTGKTEDALGGWKYCCECGMEFDNPVVELSEYERERAGQLNALEGP